MRRFAFVILLTGCQVFDPALVAPPADAAEPEVDSGPVDAGGAVTCSDGTPLRRPPPRPAGDAGGDQTIIIGLRDVGLRQTGDSWRDIGFDLDGLCTETALSDVECVPPADVAVQLDGNGGIDNAFHSLFEVVNLVFPELASTAVMSALDGVGVVTLTIRGWNGTRNDARVDVSLAQSVAGIPGTGQAAPPDVEIRGDDYRVYPAGSGEGATPLPRPAWDGEDWLWVRDEAFFMNNPEQPRVRDNNAYIADGQLVVRLPDRVEIIFAGDEQGIRVLLTDGYAVGTFDEAFERVSPMTVAGRWSVLDMLDTAAAVGICAGSTEYNILQNKLNEVADVRAVPGTGGMDVECDAVSIGVNFEGYRVRIAGLTPGQPLPNVCD
ncbi:MAG: hypothetical protein KF901_21915 [Myxococcales bacterium]|nr:hypothetical protein [Myxococcales bacterium]